MMCGGKEFKEVVKGDKNYSIGCNDCKNGAVNTANNISDSLHSPMQVAESIVDKIGKDCKCPDPAKKISGKVHDNQEAKDMAKPLCSIEGCEKKAWIDGLCAKHYTKIHGTPYKPQSQCAGRKKKVEKRTETNPLKPATKPAEVPVTISGEEALVTKKQNDIAVDNIEVVINFNAYKPLYDKLSVLAKREFRTLDAQILYIANLYFNAPTARLSSLIGSVENSDGDKAGAGDA
ncbi:MAG: hypothetical protein LLG42_11795 [Chloroflexi bacterium]|nr:hypothetical protein [Chloroflexota bacterium]